MMRIILFSRKPAYSNILLNIIGITSQRKMIYSSLAFQHCFHGNSSRLVSRIFSYVFHQFDSKYSYTVATNEVKKLSVFILPTDVDNGRSEELEKMLTLILSKGYTRKDIREKFLMYLKSSDISYAKLCLLDKIDPDILLLLPLLSLPNSILKLAAQKSRTDKLNIKDFPNRILYLSHHLELKADELIPALTKHSALLTMQFKRLDLKMNILKNANISSKYIVKDLWIFNYNEKLLDSRIQAALKAGVELKPWMLRCSEKFFQSILIKYSEKQRILGSENIYSYLAKRLDCSIEYVKHLMEKNRLLKTINIPKLEQVINFLYKVGYTPQEVRLFPRVFCSSVQSLEKRFEEFQRVKTTLPTLGQLCLSGKKATAKPKQES